MEAEIMPEFNEVAYKLSWDVEHFEELGILDWEYDIFIEEFEGYDEKLFTYVEECKHPNPIMFQAYKPVVEHIDYPYPDNLWNIMSRRMYETLLSIGDFSHRVIPIAMIDSRTQPWNWFETTTITRENAYEEGRASRYKMGKNLKKEVCFGDFVLVQMTEHLDIFDYEKSKYKKDDANSQKIVFIYEYVFKIPHNGLPPIFKIRESSTIFISAEAREIMKKEKITGITYISLKGYKSVLDSDWEQRAWTDTKIVLPD
jgi:hypothetical protein